jgi:CNT family concentrative nucleoside transporter
MDAGVVIHSLIGFFLLHALAWALSEDRKRVVWRPVVAGMVLTLALGALLLKAPLVKDLFLALNNVLNALEKATREGTTFVFGFLGGGPPPFAETYPGASFVLAFRALPLVLVVSALSALLFHWRVLPWIVRGDEIVSLGGRTIVSGTLATCIAGSVVGILY